MERDVHALNVREIGQATHGAYHALACYLPVSLDMFVVLDVSKAITNRARSNLYVCGTFAIAPEVGEVPDRNPPALR